MMTANMRHCEHFAVDVSGTEALKGAEVQISSMIQNAPDLQTIELKFLTSAYERPLKAVELSRLFIYQVHWPNLRAPDGPDHQIELLVNSGLD